jgi:hypothetical protein
LSNDSHSVGPVITKEKEVVARMIGIYCKKKHAGRSGELCAECTALLDYAQKRLDHCQFGEGKPTCRRCFVHCYSPQMRERIRAVMRFSGPRLALRAPFDWLRHRLHDTEGVQTGPQDP